MIASIEAREPGLRPAAPLAAGGPYPMGLMALLATVGMLFAAFTAALLVRRAGSDWARITLPGIIWFNTLAIVLSSLAVEGARACVRRDDTIRATNRLGVAGLVGLLFLIGQVVAWRRLAQSGVFVSSSPHAAFFYMLSVVHAAHILGGLGALAWTLNRLAQGGYTPRSHAGLTHAAVFWHFVGAAWLYLLVLLTTL